MTELHEVKGECDIYEGRIECPSGNAYEVAFRREYEWIGTRNEPELNYDNARSISVMVGGTDTSIEQINAKTRLEIELAIDAWLYDNDPEFPA